MADDNWMESPGEDAAPASEDSPSTEKEGMEGETQLGNIEAFPDAEPGKRYTVEIEKVMAKEVSYRVIGEAEAEAPAREPAMAGGEGDDEDSLMT